MSDFLKEIADLSPEKLELVARRLREKKSPVSIQSIPPRSPSIGAIPLSHAQQRLWFLHQLDPGNSTYNMPAALRLSGSLAIVALEQSFIEITRRHEILRTIFPSQAGSPIQVILPAEREGVLIRELSALGFREQEAETGLGASAEAVLPFDLAEGPLLRVMVFRLSEREHVLLVTMHHIISDAWSIGLMIRELTHLYEAYSTGYSSPLIELPFQYADYAGWERQRLKDGMLELQLDYWRARLAGAPVTLELPADHSRPAVRSYRGGTVPVWLKPRLTSRMKEFCRREGATPFMTLLAALQALLARYSGEGESVVGTTIANRRRGETEGLIGYFVNTLVLRTSLTGEPTWSELLHRAKEVVLGAYANQELPFEKVVEVLQPERDLSRSPLFQVLMELQNAPQGELALRGLKLSPLEAGTVTAKFDLRLLLSEGGGGVYGVLEYSSDLFEAETISRMAGHYEQLLEALLREPERPIALAEMLTEQQRHQVLVEWNHTCRGYVQDQCLQELIEARVREWPEAVAMVFGEQHVSYAELNRRANQLAHYLRGLGVGPEVVVALYLERSESMVEAVLGVLKAGGAYLPLDADSPLARLALMLQETQAPILLTHERRLDDLPVYHGQILCLDRERDLIERERQENPAAEVSRENLIYVIYTSGSTGAPKGVMVTQGGVANYVRWCSTAYRVGAGQGAPMHSALSFDLTVTSLYGPLVSGRAIELVREEEGVEGLLRLIRRDADYSFVKLTPAHLKLISEAGRAEDVEGWSRTLVIGGEALSWEQLRYWREHAPDTRLINEYGPTETVVGCGVYEVSAEQREGNVSIGRPITNMGMYVVDAEGTVAPVGGKGEIWIGGEGVARGYLRNAALTAGHFVPDEFSGEWGARLYRSGDKGRYAGNGEIECLGREDRQVKLRGYRIELGEIETWLRRYPGVDEAVAEVREQVDAAPRLVGYMVKPGGLDAAEEQLLQRYLAERLPEYMVPAAYVVIDKLPLTPNGKLDRKALPAPDLVGLDTKSYVAPRTTAEQILASIWERVLRVERVGIHDKFFALGGDSILSIQVVSRANKAGLRLTARQMFEHQTIAELASVAGTVEAISTEQGVVSGEVALTPIQRWFFQRDLPEPHHFNQAVLLGVPADFNFRWLEQAVSHIVAHHDALRLRFEKSKGGWRQFNAEAESGQICKRVDLSELAHDEVAATIDSVATLAQRSLDLGQGPLMRVVHFDLGTTERGRMLSVIHHLAVDGVSWRILLEDLETAYQQVSQGQLVRIGAKTTSYKDWAAGLLEYSGRADVLAELSYWKEQAKPGSPRLPLDFEQGENSEQGRAHVEVSLSIEATEALLQEVPRAYRTHINDVLLTALADTLCRWCGAESVMVDLEGHGREQEWIRTMDVSRTVGWFTTLYPVRLEVAQGEALGQALKRIKEHLRAVPRRGLGYGVLKYSSEAADVKQELEDLAQAEVSFNYLGQFDQVVGDSDLWGEAGEGSGQGLGDGGLRSHLVAIDGLIVGGQLRLSWSFGAKHRRQTIERLAWDYVDRLTLLIAHCQSAEVGGFTPSDFPLARLTQAELDQLVAHGEPVEAIYSLSPMQQGLLFHTLYEPGSGEYVVQMIIRLNGQVHIAAMERAWRAVVDRHEALRASFHWAALTEPVQVVLESVSVVLSREDWRARSEADQEALLETYLQADREKGFELDHAPLMRVALIRTGDDQFELFWSSHHLLMDGWSIPILLKEVFTCYGAYSAGRELRLERSKSYGSYIRWLQQQDMKQAEDYWRGRLKGFTEPTELRLGGLERKAGGGYGSESLQLTEEMTARLQEFGRREQVTLNTVAQGAWALLLGRYSAEPEVVYGMTVSGREAELEGIEEMVGLFINTLPVRVEIRGGRLVGEWLRELQQQQVEMRQYEYSPLVQVQGWSEVERGRSLFESILVFENYPVQSVFENYIVGGLPEGGAEEGGTGIQVSHVQSRDQTNYPLTAAFGPGNRMGIMISYDGKRFESATIERMLSHCERLLEGLTADSAQGINDIQMLTDQEVHQLVVEWNVFGDHHDGEEMVPQLLEAQAKRAPDAVAVVSDRGSLSYRELNQRSNQLSLHLKEMGVGPDVTVGLCLERSLETVIGLIGVLKAGGAYVPLDPAYPPDRLAYMLEDCAARVVLTQGNLLSALGDLECNRVCLDSDWPAIARNEDEDPKPEILPRSIAYVTYTSGTTGLPKGVLLEHQSLSNYASAFMRDYELTSNDRVLQFASLSFDTSAEEIYPALIAGAALVLRTDAVLGSSVEFVNEIRRLGITILDLPTAFWQTLTDTMPDTVKLEQLVRLVVIGGEKALRDPIIAWRNQFGDQGRLVNTYGPTESTIVALSCDLSGSGSLTLYGDHVPIGRPVANARAFIVGKTADLQPVDVIGEICIGGAGLARGYINGADLTADRFVPNEWDGHAGSRLYRTGDLGTYRGDGNIEYRGRVDHQVKVRGYRIEMGELEATLTAHAGVRAAVAMAHEIRPGDRRLVAYVVADETSPTSFDELRQHLEKYLPEYMIPSAYVLLKELPLSANGKVDRRRLPTPEQEGLKSKDLFAEPRTLVEERLVDIWSEVLGLERVGIYDNFFALGGHSLLTTQLIARVGKAFDIDIGLRTIFEMQTVAELAVAIEEIITREIEHLSEEEAEDLVKRS